MLKQLLDLSNYSYNPHAIPVMVVSIAIFSIGLFVIIQTKRSARNTGFFCLCSSLSLWLFTTGLVYLSNNPQTALNWYKYFTFFGVANIMPSAYLFSAASSGLLKKQRHFVLGSLISALFFYIAAISTDKFITIPSSYFWGYYPHYEPANYLFLLFYVIVYSVVQINLWIAFKRENIPIKKNQIGLIIAAFLIAFIASLDFVAKVWTIPIYPFGFIPMIFFVSLLAYSIIRYRAFDIETVFHKTALWVFSFSLIVIPIFFLYRAISPLIKESTMLQFVFWIFSFLALTLYLRAIQPKIDHFFQRRHSDLEEISSRFTEDLVHLKGFDSLIQRIEDTIADTLYPQQIDIFIYNDSRKAYRLANAVNTAREISELKADDLFLVWMAKNNKIIYREFVEIDPAYTSIKENAKNYFRLTEATVVVPLALNEKLLGIINLGKKANLRRYNAADLHFLTTLKNQSTIAISNSLLYENIEEQVRQRTRELTEVQKQLVQAEKLATVGTLAGGVAHEINNPLTAILTNVQMLLAAKSIDDKLDKESLELIEEATKRCRTIVQKLMTYAKRPLETAEVSKVDLLDVINKVVTFLGYQLEQENIKIITEVKEGAYLVLGNHNELEQVITNLILNGKDAIKRIKKEGVVTIAVSKNKDCVKVEVKDEGAGIPKEVVSKIFDPFFTTKDVGKGLGLGLSICQSILEKHNGLINVQSETNRGTTFTVQLPRVKEKDEVKSKVRIID
ncbi:ATP-binding protein [Candidatus Omnitrophota bacterium]